MTCSGSGRPLTTLRRYSGMSSTVSGVPCARRRTACLGILVLQSKLPNHTHHGLHILDRRIGDDPVAQIEDVPRPSSSSAQDLFDARLNHLDRCEERDGVEIALHCMSVTDFAP